MLFTGTLMKIRFSSNIIECVCVCAYCYTTSTAGCPWFLCRTFWLLLLLCGLLVLSIALVASRQLSRPPLHSINYCLLATILSVADADGFVSLARSLLASIRLLRLSLSSAHQSLWLQFCCLASRFAHLTQTSHWRRWENNSLNTFSEQQQQQQPSQAVTLLAPFWSLPAYSDAQTLFAQYLLCHLREIQLAILVLIKKLQ